MVKRDKKSQFYLVAAVVLVAIILGASVVTNYVITRAKPVKFYDLSDELQEEGSRIIDYGIYNEVDILDLIENFTQNYFIEYAKEKEDNVDFIFVYGSKESVKIAKYENDTLDIGWPNYDYFIFYDAAADITCENSVYNNHIDEKDKNLLFKNCVMNGNIKLRGGALRIDSSSIYGNIELRDAEFKLTNSYVDGNAQIIIKKEVDEKTVVMSGNDIDGNVDVDGGILVIMDNDITGNLIVKSPTIVVQSDGNLVGGETELPASVGQAESVEINLLNQIYQFNLEEGQNFFFVISKEREGEIYVTEG